MDDRRDDWRRGVDENLASLNAGLRVWEREAAAIRKTLAEIDHTLRGDTEQDTDGMTARLHNLENEINLLKGVTLRDKAGSKKSLVERVDTLEMAERKAANRWSFAGTVVVAVLSLLGLLITNWTRLAGYLGVGAPPGQLETMIDNAKHPKNRYRHYTVTVPAVEETGE